MAPCFFDKELKPSARSHYHAKVPPPHFMRTPGWCDVFPSQKYKRLCRLGFQYPYGIYVSMWKAFPMGVHSPSLHKKLH